MDTEGISVADVAIAESTAASFLPAKRSAAAIATNLQPRVSIDMFERIEHPIEAARTMGEAFAASKMFGCANVAQGFVLALACLTERRSPAEIMRKNHLIGGTLSMRSDAMLAEFRAIGGTHEIVERTADRAAIKLTQGKRSNQFEFTWAEAKTEDYVYMKDGKTPKDNWSTPRRRMQMLWARVVSDAVRAFAPEVCAGIYCPEELSADHFSEPQEAITVTSVAAQQPATAAVASGGNGSQTGKPKSPPQAKAESPTERTRDEKLADMRELKSKLGIDGTAWSKFLSRFGVRSALELDAEQIDIAIVQLRSDKWKKESDDELSRWAQEAVSGK